MKRIVIILFVFACHACATTRYFSPSGDNTTGLSWATAKTSLPTSGVSAGDLCYIDGGTTSVTWNLSAYWNPPSGTAGNVITYKIGQDAGHNGTAIFNYTGGAAASNPWVSGPTYITVSGDAGDGLMHFKLTNYAVVTSNTNNIRFSYIDASSGIGSGTGAATAFQWAAVNGCELDHSDINVTVLGADNVIVATFSGATFDDNLIHHNTLRMPYKNGGIGADGCALTGTGFSFYNNTVTGVRNNSYSAGQHADGIQMLNGSYIKIYNNTFVNCANYAVFGEAYSGDYSNVRVYNNLILNTDTEIASGSPGGVIFGVNNGSRSFTNVILANNVTVNLGANQASVALNNTTITPATFTGCYVANNISLDSGAISITGNSTSTVVTNVSISNANGAANFVTYSQYGGTANNYRLRAAASTLIAQGTDMSSFFTTDADGYTRAVPWDIGAYKWLAPTNAGRPNTSGMLVGF